MKAKDLFRIANLSIKSHKKQTANIVRGMSFAVVVLVSVLFLLFSFYIGTISKLNELNVISSVRLSYGEEASGLTIDIDDYDTVNSLSGIENSAVYNTYSLTVSYQKVTGVFQYEKVDLKPTLSFEDKVYPISGDDTVYLEFYDFDKTTAVISDAEREYLLKSDKGNAVLVGEEFTDKSKCVMISSELLEGFGIDYEYVIGKTVSFSVMLKDDGEAAEGSQAITIFGDYTVIGVFNAELYNSPSRSNHAPLFWFNETDLIENPYLSQQDDEGEAVYQKSPSELSEKSVTGGYVFIPFGYNCSEAFSSGFNQILQFGSFQSLYNGVADILGCAQDGNENYLFTNCTTQTFQDFYDNYPFLQLVCVIILVFGAVILVTALLNTYNTMRYSIDNRKQYLKMLNAIGMTPGEIKTLYFCEIVLIILRCLIITAVLSFAECVALKFWFGSGLSSFTAELPIALTLNLIYYLPAFLIAAFALFALSLGIFSLCVIKKENFTLSSQT